jgi:hypothetical protein
VIEKIRDFWLQSYHSDRTAFWFELAGFVFVVGSSLYLAVNALNPDMRVVYPVAFVGAASQCYAAIRRGAAWVSVLTGYFCIINVFGFGRAMGWW